MLRLHFLTRFDASVCGTYYLCYFEYWVTCL